MGDTDNKYPLALPAGTVLAGQYVIQKVLGQGGFGITYEAVDHKNGSKVAVKEFFPDSMATRTNATIVTPFTGERGESYTYGKTCFLDEAKTLAQFIGNQNIVRIHTYFEEYGTAYFVMDYVEGTSFDRYIRSKGGKISFEEAKNVLLPIMDALAVVHSKGIIHRDVTPDNIYITNEGIIKLLDFGAARYSLGDKSRSLDVVLKHGFAPKEQYTRHGKQGPFTDVYALGATFYFALTGKRPPDSVERLDEDDLVPPSALGVAIDPKAEDAILKALSVQAGDRYQSMTAFKQGILGASSVSAATAVAADGATNRIEFTAPAAPAATPVQAAVTPSQQIMPSQQITPSQQIMLSQQIAPSQQIMPSQQITPSQQIMPSQQITPSQQIMPSQQITPSQQIMPSQQITPSQQIPNSGYPAQGQYVSAPAQNTVSAPAPVSTQSAETKPKKKKWWIPVVIIAGVAVVIIPVFILLLIIIFAAIGSASKTPNTTNPVTTNPVTPGYTVASSEPAPGSYSNPDAGSASHPYTVVDGVIGCDENVAEYWLSENFGSYSVSKEGQDTASPWWIVKFDSSQKPIELYGYTFYFDSMEIDFNESGLVKNVQFRSTGDKSATYNAMITHYTSEFGDPDDGFDYDTSELWKLTYRCWYEFDYLYDLSVSRCFGDMNEDKYIGLSVYVPDTYE